MKFSAQVMKVWQRFQQVLASGQSCSTNPESHVWLLQWPHSVLQPKKVRWDSDIKGIKSLKIAGVAICGSKAGGDAGDRAEHCIHQLGHCCAWGSWPLQHQDSPRESWAEALQLSFHFLWWISGCGSSLELKWNPSCAAFKNKQALKGKLCLGRHGAGLSQGLVVWSLKWGAGKESGTSSALKKAMGVREEDVFGMGDGVMARGHSSKGGNTAQGMLLMCLGRVLLHKPEKSWDTKLGCDQQARVLQLQDSSVWV